MSPGGGIVKTGFILSRYWGREPHWFFSQPKQLQAELIAHYNIEHTKKEDVDRKKKRYNLNRIKEAQAKFMRRGSDGEK